MPLQPFHSAVTPRAGARVAPPGGRLACGVGRHNTATSGLLTTVFVALAFWAGVTSATQAQDHKVRLGVSPSVEACLKFAERFSDFGQVRSVQFEHLHQKLLVIWVRPRPSDPQASIVFGYFLKARKWYLFLDEVKEGRASAVLIPPGTDNLVVRDDGGVDLIVFPLARIKALSAHPGR